MRRAAGILLQAALAAPAAGALPDSARKERDSLALSYTVVPYFMYTPETQWGGGGAGGFFKRLHPRARPSSLLAQGLYTQRNQYQAGIHADHHAPGNLASAWLDVSFREFPDRFFGIGPDTPDSLEEAYTARSFLVAAQAMRSVGAPSRPACSASRSAMT